jgi:hypothetical protein
MWSYNVTDNNTCRSFPEQGQALVWWAHQGFSGTVTKVWAETGIVMDTIIGSHNRARWESGDAITFENQDFGRRYQKFLDAINMVPATPVAQEPLAREPISVPAAIQPPTAPAPVIQPIAPVQVVSESVAAELQAKLDKMATVVEITDAEINEKKEELDRKFAIHMEQRQEVEAARNQLIRDREREEQALRVFQSGKQSYREMKRDIVSGAITEKAIPDMFRSRYKIYKRMDERALLDLPDEWENFNKIGEELKREMFEQDRGLYTDIRDSIAAGELTIDDVSADFRTQYDVFVHIEGVGMLDHESCYDMFTELCGHYLKYWNDIKYGFNDVHYMDDVKCQNAILMKDARNRKHQPTTLSSDDESSCSSDEEDNNDDDEESSDDESSEVAEEDVPDNDAGGVVMQGPFIPVPPNAAEMFGSNAMASQIADEDEAEPESFLDLEEEN